MVSRTPDLGAIFPKKSSGGALKGKKHPRVAKGIGFGRF
ncbi:unannotated protein [freshwater metagenome]|uniref:Unannotated protein n=1 Tax=freshwater metagenome TaxID=449393 RepID=A0A6J7JZH0_9ZZZZ